MNTRQKLVTFNKTNP